MPTPRVCVVAAPGVALSVMIGIIYKYTSPSGKIYIGQTTQEKRRRNTFLNVNKNYGGDKIDAARRKYLPENFAYEVIERYSFKSADEARTTLDEREEYFISLFDSYHNGYNMTFGGMTTTGMKASQETRRKLSFLRKGRKGTPQTVQQKKAQSERMKALYANPDWKAKRLMIDRNEATRQKHSLQSSGVNNGMFGKKASPEARAKMSAARSGEKNCRYSLQLSESHKAKVSDALRQYYRDNSVGSATRKKISERIKVAVRQLTMNGELVAEYDSPSSAEKITGINASYIVKVCKGKRPAANGFRWEYASSCGCLQSLDPQTWIGSGEASALSGRHRNVLKYHMDVIKDLPFKKVGRKRYVHKPTLLKLYNIAL